jgi:hypothetical protein
MRRVGGKEASWKGIDEEYFQFCFTNVVSNFLQPPHRANGSMPASPSLQDMRLDPAGSGRISMGVDLRKVD